MRALVNCCDRLFMCDPLLHFMQTYGLLWALNALNALFVLMFYKFLIFKSSKLRFGCETSTSTLHLRRIWGSFFPPPGIEGVGVKLPVYFRKCSGLRHQRPRVPDIEMVRNEKSKISDHNLGETNFIKLHYFFSVVISPVQGWDACWV